MGVTGYKRVTNVGVRIPGWATQFQPMIRGVLTYVRENQLNWRIVGAVDTAQEVLQESVDAAWTGDGVIVFRPDMSEMKAWSEAGVEVVNVSAESASSGVSSVVADDFQLGGLAAKHLADVGVRHFAYVGSFLKNYSQQRFAGFSAELDKSGKRVENINIPVERYAVEERAKSLQQALKAPLEHLPKGVGVLVRDDVTAMAVLNCAQDLGIEVPREMMVMGVGNALPHCQLAWPPLTSVSYPAEKVGYHAARILDQKLRGVGETHITKCKSNGVVQRESTNLAYASGDALVKSVHQYIRERAQVEDIDIGSLGEVFGVSYSLLRKRFREVIGRSLRDEVVRIRLERMRELLVGGRHGLYDVADLMDFPSVETMSRFFTRKVGVAPSVYREKVLDES